MTGNNIKEERNNAKYYKYMLLFSLLAFLFAFFQIAANPNIESTAYALNVLTILTAIFTAVVSSFQGCAY